MKRWRQSFLRRYMVFEQNYWWFHLPQSTVFNAFSVLGIATGDTQNTRENTRDLGTGVPKTRGYSIHCDTTVGKGPGIGRSHDPRTPKNHLLMAVPSSETKFLSVFRRVGFSLNNGNFPSLNFKPLQMKCFEYMPKGQAVIGVSYLLDLASQWMLSHLLPHFIPVKTTKNIVILVCRLNSIIEDQLKV